jgi:hypothetical protein
MDMPEHSPSGASGLIRRLAQQILADHRGAPGGSCETCAATWPCSPAQLAWSALSYRTWTETRQLAVI